MKCPECKRPTYKKDYGCTSCGLGNPFRGISCLTPLATKIFPPSDPEAALGKEPAPAQEDKP